MAYDKLFEPIRIGSVEIANRYVMGPTNYLFCDWLGLVNEQELAYVVARAKGGPGLVIYGAVLCTKLGMKVAPHPWIYLTDVEHLPGLATLTESVHLCGAKIFIQVLPSAGGRTRPWSDEPPVSPSGIDLDMESMLSRRAEGKILLPTLGASVAMEHHMKRPPSRTLSTEEIENDIIKETAKNCKLAVWAGFDGIEIHACHYVYLLDQFRSPLLNKRTDKYGGNEDNRNRVILEITDAVIRSVKEEKSNFPVGIRVSAESYGAYTFEETMRLAKQLEEVGIDYFHITTGYPWHPKTNYYAEEAPLLGHSSELKKALRIPIMMPNCHDPNIALEAVSNGSADLIALARPLMADPNYVNKVRQNKLAEINKCKKENYCFVPFWMGLPGRCQVNPELGRERYNSEYWIIKGSTGTDMFPQFLKDKITMQKKARAKK